MRAPLLSLLSSLSTLILSIHILSIHTVVDEAPVRWQHIQTQSSDRAASHAYHCYSLFSSLLLFRPSGLSSGPVINLAFGIFQFISKAIAGVNLTLYQRIEAQGIMSGFEVSSAASLEGTRVPEVIAVASVGMVLSTIAVVLRFISRSQTGRVSVDMFWWDDWAILATLIMSHGFLAVNIAWTKYGLGIHFLAIPFSDAVVNNNISHAQILIYAVCIWMIKISTLLLYARIFKFSRKFATTLWAVGGVVTAWFICTAVVPWFNCTPVAKTLNLFEPGECYDRMPWFYASAFINAFFDLLILVLPMPAISRLQMTFRKKILLVIVFVLGYSSAFLSFARFIMIIRDPDLMSTQPSADATCR